MFYCFEYLITSCGRKLPLNSKHYDIDMGLKLMISWNEYHLEVLFPVICLSIISKFCFLWFVRVLSRSFVFCDLFGFCADNPSHHIIMLTGLHYYTAEEVEMFNQYWSHSEWPWEWFLSLLIDRKIKLFGESQSFFVIEQWTGILFAVQPSHKRSMLIPKFQSRCHQSLKWNHTLC